MASGKGSRFDKVLVIVGAVVSINVVSIAGTYLLDIKEKAKYKLILIQCLLATQSLLFLTSRYLWLRLCSPLFNSPSTLNRIIFLLLIVVIILAQGSIVLGTIFSGVEPHWISLLSYICLGIFVLLTTATLLSDFVTWLFGTVNTRSGSLTTKSRYARFHVIGIIIISFILAMVALYNGLNEPLVKNLKLPVKNLPPEFNDFTIVHLPDLHVGPTVGKTMLEKTVRTVNQLNPDVIALTGDLVDSTVYQIRQAVKPLLKLKARYGVYFVTGTKKLLFSLLLGPLVSVFQASYSAIAGNHEYYTGDVDGWLKELEYLGVTPLHNSHVILTHLNKPHAKICLAGVDDIEGGFLRSGDHGSDLTKALRGVNRNIPTILLAHRPKVAKLALDDYGVDAVLTGHTHGGQLFPIHLWHLIREPYFAGLYQHKSGSYVYVSSGVHFWGMPMRLWSEAEITRVTLTTTS